MLGTSPFDSQLPFERCCTQAASTSRSWTNSSPRSHLQLGASFINSQLPCVFRLPPGDFNLALLDELISEPRLKMISCCNELNAG